MTITSSLIWTNFVQPDEGYDWINSAEFLSEDEAKKAAVALTSVQAASSAIVIVVDGDNKIARYEYQNGTETLIFDDRVEPLFKLHGKLGS